jgi:phenylalanyl-tRNA synthetase beta chain
MPSLLDIAQPNIKQGFDEFALFEINKCHYKPDGLNSENVPNEVDRLALIVASKKPKSGAAYYQAKRLLDFVSSNYKLRLDYRSLKDQHSPIASPFEPRRSAELVDSRSGKVIGFIGEYKKSVARDFKLPEYSAGFEVNTRELFSLLEEVGNNYKPLSRYPSTERDICFKVDQSIECAKILDIINGVMTNTDINATVEVVDIYKQEGSDMKNITVRVKLVAYDRTLNGLEVGEFINSVVNLVVVQLGATVV